MASLNAVAFRLVHVVKLTIFPSTVSRNLRATGNNLFLQNVRVYSNDTNTKSENSFDKPKEVRKKTVPIQKVLLLSEQGKIIDQVTLEQAQQLAKRRNLNLVKIVDVSLKTVLPTYQLMSKMQLLEEKSEAKKQKAMDKSTLIKATKDFIFSNKIEEHDLEVKMNKMSKLLTKHHKLRIYVTMSPNAEDLANTIKLIETRLSENGKLLHKTKSASGVKLYFDPILPQLEEKEKEKEKETKAKK